jgi:hypothetical protein
MEFNGHRDPYPRWFPMFLMGLCVTGVIAYQVLV